ncbi:MAG: hypothetical protein EXS16_07735 [Gemmataceae bacterium]|nr:hypothetical protein [Gemmataceae bacterium]
MKQTTLESLEKRVEALELSLAQALQSQPKPGKFKDWRLAVGKYKRTELSEAVDAAGRKIREADRRKAGS